MVLPLLLVLAACRPAVGTPGGYSAADDLRTMESPSGRVRVHYSDRGPNAVDQSDGDGDGVPDRVERIGASTEHVLRYYETLGFAPPPTQAELGVGTSDALDVFLVPIPENDVAAAWAAHERCVGVRCAVFLVMASDDELGEGDLGGVIAHEAFHGVQAGYDSSEPRWLIEGMAAHMGAGLSSLGFTIELQAADYLSEPACGLADIDYGHPCGEAAYGSGLLWSFLEARVSEDIVLRVLEATVEHQGVDALAAALRAEGASLSEEWPHFAAWNVATGLHADGSGYAFARDVSVEPEAAGPAIAVPANFAPLSARYYRVDHAGGPLWLGVAGDPGPLRVTVHRVAGGGPEGPFDPMRGPYGLPVDGALDLGDYAPGDVWLSVSHPEADGAVEIGLCAGAAEADVDPCLPGVHGCTAGGRGPSAATPLLAALLALAARRRQKPGPPPTTNHAP